MTAKEKSAVSRTPGRTGVQSRKRRQAIRRARRRRRVATAAVIGALSLALIGLGVWLLFGRHPEVTMRVYPMEYEGMIRARADENGLDPALVAAVILAESDYRPEVVSEANAQGLMQLLPSTAEWIAGKFDEVYEEGCLFAPETNVKYGSWYLGFLMRRFGGDATKAVAAYHAGQGRVDEWLANPEYSPDGIALETIPSDATRTYVERVLRYYEKYRELYASAP